METNKLRLHGVWVWSNTMGDMKSSDPKIFSDTDAHVVITQALLYSVSEISGWLCRFLMTDSSGILQHWYDFIMNLSNIQKQAEDKISKFSNGSFFNYRHFGPCKLLESYTFHTFTGYPQTVFNCVYASITDKFQYVLCLIAF